MKIENRVEREVLRNGERSLRWMKEMKSLDIERSKEEWKRGMKIGIGKIVEWIEKMDLRDGKRNLRGEKWMIGMVIMDESGKKMIKKRMMEIEIGVGMKEMRLWGVNGRMRKENIGEMLKIVDEGKKMKILEMMKDIEKKLEKMKIEEER